MPIVPTPRERITVNYISPTMGLVTDITIEEANAYEKNNPGTIFIFVDGEGDINYLGIEQVNLLTVDSLLRVSPCVVTPRKCGPPVVNIYGGGGIGAIANPIIDPNGVLIAVDLVSGGFGYTSAPRVAIIDECDLGSGAVVNAEIDDGGSVSNIIISDGGTGYVPGTTSVIGVDNVPLPDVTPGTGEVIPQINPSDPDYPVVLQLDDVIVERSGINYNCSEDNIVITPSNGTELAYTCDPFGRINGVTVKTGGYFTEVPTIAIESNTGVNAKFIPTFKIIREVEEIVERGAVKVVYVKDLVGLTINGYLDGKPFYGKVFFEDGIKYAGVSGQGGAKIRVYDTRIESINKEATSRVNEVVLSRGQTEGTVAFIQEQEVSTNQVNYGYITESPSPSPAPSPAPAPSPPPSGESDGGGY